MFCVDNPVCVFYFFEFFSDWVFYCEDGSSEYFEAFWDFDEGLFEAEVFTAAGAEYQVFVDGIGGELVELLSFDGWVFGCIRCHAYFFLDW